MKKIKAYGQNVFDEKFATQPVEALVSSTVAPEHEVLR